MNDKLLILLFSIILKNKLKKGSIYDDFKKALNQLQECIDTLDDSILKPYELTIDDIKKACIGPKMHNSIQGLFNDINHILIDSIKGGIYE